MAELKTKPTGKPVSGFLRSIRDDRVREDSRTLVRMMSEATGARPKMWGSSIVGFGSYPLRYASGRELKWFTAGFSPRKQNLTLYSIGGFAAYRDLLSKLGKHSLGTGCLYIKALDQVHLPTLKKLVQRSVKDAEKYRRRIS